MKGGGGGGGEKKEKPWKTCISVLVQLRPGLRWGLPCVSMCHSKSAQPSHPGWGEHKNKGLEQQGQPWTVGGGGGCGAAPSHNNGKAASWSGSVPAQEGTLAEEQRQPGGERRRHVSPRKSGSKMMTL